MPWLKFVPLVDDYKRSQVETVFDDRLGVVDFHLTDKVTALYLIESEMLQIANAKKKIVKFRKGSLQMSCFQDFVRDRRDGQK